MQHKFASLAKGARCNRSSLRSQRGPDATEARFARKWGLLCNRSSIRSQGVGNATKARFARKEGANATKTRFARKGSPMQQKLASLAKGGQCNRSSLRSRTNFWDFTHFLFILADFWPLFATFKSPFLSLFWPLNSIMRMTFFWPLLSPRYPLIFSLIYAFLYTFFPHFNASLSAL